MNMVKLEVPDKGQAWAVAIAVCFVNIIAGGLAKLRPLLYVAVIATYGVPRQDAAEPFAIAEAMRCLGGPITGVIGQRYGIKAATFGGGVIASLGIALSWIAPNVFWLTIFWGGLFGFGFGLTTTLCPVLINQYFVKYKATASGIAFSGSNIGSLVLPFILKAVLAAFGLSGGFLILSGITLHILPLSLLLKTPQWLENPKHYARLKALKMKQWTSETLEKGLPGAPPEENRKVHVQECRVVKLPSALGNRPLEEPDKCRVVKLPPSLGNSPLAELDKCSIDGSLEENNSRKNSSGTGGIISAQKSRPTPVPTISGVLEKIQSDINSSAECEKAYEVSSIKKTSLLESIRGIGTLHTSPVFVVISVCMAMYTIICISIYITIVDYSKDKRIPESYGIYIINSITTGDLIGRLCFGWMTDKKFLSISTYIAMLFILQAVIILLLPLVMNLYFFMLLMILYGTTVGTFVAHYPLLILRFVDSNLQSVAMGCEGLLSGIAAFAIPIIVGYFRDDVGSYDGMFYMLGTIAVVSACFWFLIPRLIEFQNKKAEQNKILRK